ncbi:hypothetical protein TcWFU_002329 [Taenia crassiceps]|uniref:Uncharacterized protein n=1 Tax=Taenia crassiceps TaxID=6207 RepID=A0ABR4Q607_9CEST
MAKILPPFEVMSIRKRKPFELGRYLGPISSKRIRRLEAIKQLLLELDNRLKMEMHGLRELVGSPVNVSEELDGFATKIPYSPTSEALSISIARTTLTSRGQSSPETPDRIHPERIFFLPSNPLIPSSTPALPLIPPLQQPPEQRSQIAAFTTKGKENDIPVVVASSPHDPSPTLGLRGSLEPSAFLSYASDLLVLPTHISASKDSRQEKKSSSSKENSTKATLFTSSTNSRPSSQRTVCLTRSQFTEPSSETSVSHRNGSEDQASSSSDVGISASEDYLRPKKTKSLLDAHVRYWCVSVIILFIFVAICLLFWSSSSPDLKTEVDIQMKQLMDAFPNQSTRLWATVKGALLSQPRSPSQWLLRAEEKESPTVLLLAPTTPGDNFRRFIERFGEALRALGKHLSCVKINPFDSSSNTSPEVLKRKLHDQLNEAYKQHKRCLHVVAIDRLPGEAALVLHGFSDPISSPLRNAFLLLSFERPPNLQPGTTHRDMETHLRRYLRSLWDTELGIDEACALISRLTRQIGIFNV